MAGRCSLAARLILDLSELFYPSVLRHEHKIRLIHLNFGDL